LWVRSTKRKEVEENVKDLSKKAEEEGRKEGRRTEL
jgi:hypothetical protein